MRTALLLLATVLLGCSSQTDQAGPTPAPTPNPSPTQTPTPTPDPGETPTPASGADCATDADCTTTTYGPEPAKDARSCCASLACPRVETAKRAADLSASFSSMCGAVRCRAPDCPAGTPEPVATCTAGRCAAR
jgi:hypothetical protein